MTIDTRPLRANPEDLAALAGLFGAERTTRHCWCTAFCVNGRSFAAGWFGGGNRRRFARLAAASTAPMGLLATVDGAPVGWCACGPRSRYTAAVDGRSRLLRDRPREEDDTVWLVACLFVAAPHRGRGVTSTLVRAAVDLARDEGAPAIEGWPLAASATRPAEAFVGREEVFRAAGFDRVDQPAPERVTMWRGLRGHQVPPVGFAPTA